MTFTRETRRRGLEPSSAVLERSLRPATETEAAALGLPPGAAVVHVRRLRCADGLPMAIETAVLVGATASVVLDADLEHGSLHELLGRAGFALRRGSGTIEAAAATDDDAERLGVPVGSPLLVERRVIADAHGRRIEATESRYPGDRYALDVRFEVEGGNRGRTMSGRTELTGRLVVDDAGCGRAPGHRRRRDRRGRP